VGSGVVKGRAGRALLASLGILVSLAIAGTTATAVAHVEPPAETVATAAAQAPAAVTVRFATFNLEDVRTTDLVNPDGSPKLDQPRLKRLAEVIQRIAPNVIFLNEIAYDMPGAPGFKDGDQPGQNARRFVEQYLAVPQAPGLAALKFEAFMAPSNTGVPSGFDLDNDGRVVKEYPEPPGASADGEPGKQLPGGRSFGNDCHGFGTFPGQYAMALLVDPRLTIQRDKVRTFRLIPWDYVPAAAWPTKADGSSFFDEEERKVLRLSSKSHWDVPILLPNGSVVHALCSHPTPPAFDGKEMRNKKRNHDEIRFWGDYIDQQSWIVDDANQPGGLERGEMFVIMGDLNADPAKGSSWKNPVGKWLFSLPRVNREFTPVSPIVVPELEPSDTAGFKMRVDYVIPSTDLEVLDGAVWRDLPGGGATFPSDHFPVWADLSVPGR
jgi:hypothetical protein